LCDSRHGSQVIPEIPILIRTKFTETVLPGFVLDNILENPTERRRIGPNFRLDLLGKPRSHTGEIFEGPRTRPVNVSALLEDHINIGVPKVRDAANGPNFRRASHGGENGISDLVLDNIRASIPTGENDYLGLAEVWEGIQRQMKS